MTNKTFRLFISSTFVDFQQERACLNQAIAPRIRQYCQALGYEFQLVDLRWGISTEAALNQQTLPICLDEIKRCKEFSPRPNFLMMLGNRYGWVPLPASMPRSVFAPLFAACPPAAQALLAEWYLLDENALVPEYLLKQREGMYAQQAEWSAVEERIRAILLSAAQALGYPQDELRFLTNSATAHEIEAGFFQQSAHSSGSIVLFRNDNQESDAAQKATALKESVLQNLQAEDAFICLDVDDAYLGVFERCITEQVCAYIKKEVDRIAHAQQAQDLFAAPAPKEKGLFFGRETELAQLQQYVTSAQRDYLLVRGESGSGKTALLNTFLQGCGCKTYCVFYGEGHFSLVESLALLCDQLSRDYHFSLDDAGDTLSERFVCTMQALAPPEPVLIVIDAIEMFYDTAELQAFALLQPLPQNVKFIISFAGEMDALFAQQKNVLTLPIFRPEDSALALAGILRFHGRAIKNTAQQAMLQQALAGGAMPLRVVLLSNICTRWRSGDVATTLSHTNDGLVKQYFAELSTKRGHDASLLQYALALIAAAPYGVTEDEILGLLLQFDAVKQTFAAQEHYQSNLQTLPFVVWSRLFYDSKEGLIYAVVKNQVVIRFKHKIFYDVCTETYQTEYQQATAQLQGYYMAQPLYHGAQQEIPNARKILSLPPLLKRQGETGALIALFVDANFIDGSIKIGALQQTQEQLSALVPAAHDSQRQALLDISGCIQANREQLGMYRDAFLRCYQLHCRQNAVQAGGQSQPQTLYYPYNTSCKLSWCPDGSMYAVASMQYVTIWQKTPQIEICKIYLPVAPEEEQVVREIFWLSANRIAICINKKGIYQYRLSVQQKEAVLYGEVAVPQEVDQMIYNPTHQTIIYRSGRKIVGVALDTQTQVFQFRCKGMNPWLCNAWQQAHFLIKSTRHLVTVTNAYAVKDGSLAKRKIRWYGGSRTIGLPLAQLGEHQYLFCCADAFFVHDAQKKKTRWFYPPQQQDMIGQHTQGTKLLCAYPYGVLVIDFAQGATFRFFKAANVTAAAFVGETEEVCVQTSAQLCLFPLEATAKEYPAFYCKKPIKHVAVIIFRSLRMIAQELKRYFATLGDIFVPYHLLESAWAFEKGRYNDGTDVMAINVNTPQCRTASIVKASPAGLLAVAYEQADTVCIYNSAKEMLVQLDRLALCVANSILGMGFSADETLFFLWRNQDVTVVELATGKLLLKRSLCKAPAVQVRFAADAKALQLRLADFNWYTIALQQTAPKTALPSIPLPPAINVRIPYGLVPTGETLQVQQTAGFWGMPLATPCEKMTYFSAHHSITFDGAQFFLDGDMQTPFAAPYYDFAAADKVSLQKKATAAARFLFCKNDLFSTLYKAGSNHLVLVCRRLASVIVFDLVQKKVQVAYRHTGEIIGASFADGKHLVVYSDTDPTEFTYTIEV